MGTIVSIDHPGPSMWSRIGGILTWPRTYVELQLYQKAEAQPFEGLREIQRLQRPIFYVSARTGNLHDDLLCFFDPRHVNLDVWSGRKAWETLRQMDLLQYFVLFSGCDRFGGYNLKSTPQFASELEELFSLPVRFTCQIWRGYTRASIYSRPVRLAKVTGKKYYQEAGYFD